MRKIGNIGKGFTPLEMRNKFLTGFTLFEILIVVAIIGLLLLIALPNYVEGRNRAARNLCASNQKIIYTAAMMYATNETDSLEEIGNDRDRIEALIDKRYLRNNKCFECPSSSDNDYDDYAIIFENGAVSDIQCKEKPYQHIWP